MIDRHHRRNHVSSNIIWLISLPVLLVGLLLASACGNSDTGSEAEFRDYEIAGRDAIAQPTPTAASRSVAEATETARELNVINIEGDYSVGNFENLTNFKLNKHYDVEGLKGAEAAIYGFFGPDPYNRQEYEARFYPDHETALTIGVDFANEATGSDAVLASSIQRWDEGLSQRRTCAANVRGSHHSGRCDIAKYGDFVIAGNLVLLCQGRDSESALQNCEALFAAMQ